jgi:hypothetical protein
MSDILLDAALRTRLERLGQHHAASFSWQKSAARTLNAYYEVAGVQQRLDLGVKAGVA